MVMLDVNEGWPHDDFPIKPYSRAPKILKLLYEHGPMPVSVIGSLLVPPIEPRRTRDAMWSLRVSGLVIARYAAKPDSQPAYYQLSAREIHRKYIAAAIGIEESKLRDLRVRDQEIFHSIDCARWAEHLKRKFPGASVLRENRLHADPNAKDVLNIEFKDFEVKPDIIVQIPMTDETPPLRIAFEIERSRKSPKRIERKLRNFAQATWCDGIIYATNDTGIQELVRKVWVSQNLHRGTSIDGYPNMTCRS
jgi:hypothetical protein